MEHRRIDLGIHVHGLRCVRAGSESKIQQVKLCHVPFAFGLLVWMPAIRLVADRYRADDACVDEQRCVT